MRAAAFAAVVLIAVACAVQETPHERATTRAPVTVAESLLAVGEALHGEEKFDSAHAVLSRALDVARAAGDERTTALVFTRLGLASWRLGNLPAAAAAQDSALQLKLRLKMDDELSRSYNALGLLALSEGRNGDAARLFEQALAAALSVSDQAGAARATGNAGLAYGYLGDLRRARESHRAMRAAGRTLEDARIEANALANEAMTDVAEGDPVSATARLDTARTLYRTVSYALGEQNALGQLATAIELTGEYGRAFAVLDTALRLARTAGTREQEIEALRLLGGLHVRIGDHRRGVRYYEDAEAAATAAGLSADLGSVYRGTAEAHLLLGNGGAARAAGTNALDLHTATGEPLEQLDDLLLLARIEDQLGNANVARAHVSRADSVARSLGTRGAIASVTLARARRAEIAGDARVVLRTLNELDPVTKQFDFEAAWIAASLASRAYAKLGLLDSAAARGREAVNALEHVRGGLSLEPARNTFTAERASVYGELVVILLRQGRTEEAFAISDRARSRGLFEHLTSARGTAREGRAAQLVEADALLRRIDALVEALRQSERGRPGVRGTPDDDRVQGELASARSEYEAIMLRATGAGGRDAALAGARPTSFRSVAASLAADEALVQYLVLPQRLVLFVVRSGRLTAIETTIDEASMSERVRLLRDLWGSPREDWQVALPAADALHRDLIGPLRAGGHLRGARRLVIVPHGMLAQIPYAALRDPATGRFVGEEFGIVYTPSAVAFAALRSGQAGARRTGVQAWAFAPLPRELPGTQSEVRAFTESVERARNMVGSRATEEALRRALAGEGIVHLATHGVLNRRHPMFSRIELARPRSPEPGNDGRLDVRELLGIKVRSPLVFLSGCETGAVEGWLPEPIRGSGELTLSQAFLMAGARNVVSTLWRIEDEGASRFAGHFYRYLRDVPAAEALSQSQRELIRDPRYGSPYYWAGYVLSGDGEIEGPAARTARASVR